MLIDLESQNGTRVNDALIQEHTLQNGEEIRIADHRYVFLATSEDVPVTPPISDIALLTDEDRGKTITLRARLADETLPPSITQGSAGHASLMRKLQQHLGALHQMSQIMVTNVDQSILLSRICELLVRSFAAQRACIALQDSMTGEFVQAAVVHSTRVERCDLPMSRTIIERVCRERSSLLGTDARIDPRLKDAPSIVGHEIRSVMCVPLIRGDELLGVFYLDNQSIPRGFTDEDLWLLRAIGNQASVIIENFHLMSSLRRRVEFLEEQAEEGEPTLIGDSAAIRHVAETGRRAADSNATVLILGESGTGKEVLARSIHRWSPRKTKPIVIVNCAVLAEQLLHSDLFGHEKGAFTGAIRQKIGRLELADGGTVFLDEIGELASDLQVKLLRFLQEREFERVGGTRPIRVDVRIIAATNRDLAAEVHRGRFREDLFYRLRVIEIEMPPLRERRQDIPILAADFLRDCMRETGRDFRGFSRDARALLKSYDWPGNVRELRNAIERAVVLATGSWIEASDLTLGPSRSSLALDRSVTGYHDKIRELRKQVIQEAIDEADGIQATAARNLGLSPAYLSRLMKNLDLR